MEPNSYYESPECNSKALCDAIALAFSANSYPGNEHLTVYDLEGRLHDETFQLLRGKPWQDFPVDEFLSGDTPIPDLTPAAFHYYMPSLLIASIGNSVRDSDVASSLSFYLSPHSARCTDMVSFHTTKPKCTCVECDYLRRISGM